MKTQNEGYNGYNSEYFLEKGKLENSTLIAFHVFFVQLWLIVVFVLQIIVAAGCCLVAFDCSKGALLVCPYFLPGYILPV